jgi:hypothetical protein
VLKVTSLLDVGPDGVYMVLVELEKQQLLVLRIDVYCSMWKVYTLTIHANIPTIKI